MKYNFFEGLRGLCCLIVIIDHCVNTFAPWIRSNETNQNSILKIISETPLNLIYSGIPSVYLFFLMSGFVLSLGYWKYGESYLAPASIRRIPRLVIPCFFAAILFYTTYKISASLNIESQKINLIGIIKESLYYAPFKGQIQYNGPLWTISNEIIGTFLVFSILAIFGREKYFALIPAIIIPFVNTNMALFLIGSFFCYLFCKKEDILDNKFIQKSLPILLPVSLFFLSYPHPRDGVHVTEFYSLISWSGNSWGESYTKNAAIGATLFFTILCFSKRIQKFLSKNILVKIGSISFSAYLIHMVAINFLAPIPINITNSEILNFAIKTTLTLTATIAMAIPFEKYIDKSSIKISKNISNYFK